MSNEVSSTNSILAVITLKENSDYIAGGAPTFFVEDVKELDKTSMMLARLTLGMVHDIGNNIKLIIKH